ncbi:hypothetical protein HYH02_005141 [Chlamydomonas schloesseri]|uniref:YHYH domain-containing protein n=1 Tax=Chlamydomonas schloesseri TaxID=2026947 RepID=A0A835WKY9_9CHLO|nr:hypothetical protein HYH02_005141 [Chlamydomonas schloesseri]|eukprot:KAG2449608.1 hypothetical protein HYH02_005141 [Chlamydomonas schloesseri]
MTFKVPLSYALMPDSGASNAGAFLTASDQLGPTSSGAYIPLPKAGPTAFSINGAAIFPPYNDRAVLTWEACEIDKCNAHVGQGFDYHYHGDPFGPSCLYNTSSYGTNTHPPLIGFGLDGPWLFGRYTSSGQPGFSVALDACGGHTHDSMPYHYHSQVLSQTTSGGVLKDVAAGQTYTAYPAGPLGCWRGNISSIPNFWDEKGHTAAYGNPRDAPPAISSRSDYALLRPCCGSTSYYLAPGFSLNGAAARVASTYSGPATPAISDPADSSSTTTTSNSTTTATGSPAPAASGSGTTAAPASAPTAGGGTNITAGPAANGTAPPPSPGKNGAGSRAPSRAGALLMLACGILSLLVFSQS